MKKRLRNNVYIGKFNIKMKHGKISKTKLTNFLDPHLDTLMLKKFNINLTSSNLILEKS